MRGKIATIIFTLSFFGGAAGRPHTAPPPTEPAFPECLKECRWPDRSEGNSFLAEQVELCKVSNSSARVCADQLVDNFEHHFGNGPGCLVSKAGNNPFCALGYGDFLSFYHFEYGAKYGATCFLHSFLSVNRT